MKTEQKQTGRKTEESDSCSTSNDLIRDKEINIEVTELPGDKFRIIQTNQFAITLDNLESAFGMLKELKFDHEELINIDNHSYRSINFKYNILKD